MRVPETCAARMGLATPESPCICLKCMPVARWPDPEPPEPPEHPEPDPPELDDHWGRGEPEEYVDTSGGLGPE